MLDASIRTEVLKLMLNLIRKTNCSVLYITHDLALARYICDRIAVMYLGKIVEVGDAEEVIRDPKHPYTKALLAAIPIPDPTARKTKILIRGDVPSAINPPSGCRLHPRCPYAIKKCGELGPEVEPKRLVACHLVERGKL